MPGENERQAGEASDDDDASTDAEARGRAAVDRREYLKAAAAGAATLGGLGAGVALAGAATEGGPPNPENWTLSFEDTFDAGSLDTDLWSVGYGWGLTDRNSAGRVSADEVAVTDGRLHLSVTYDGNITTSAVNTKDQHYYGPGSYWEASIKLPGRTGILPAFWSKPNTEDWPPEIDFIEIFQNDGGREDTHRAEYHVHYSSSTVSDDSSTHESLDVEHDSSADLTEGFHVYGCRWLDDRVDFYFDDVHVGTISDSTAMEALRNGGPHYMMLTNMVDKVGTTDKSDHWTEEMVVDWVRVWEAGSDGSGDSPDDGTGDPDDGTDGSADDLPHTITFTGSTDEAEHYSVTVSGDIRKSDEGDASINPDDSIDGSTATGQVFWSVDAYDFSGEITDLQVDGDPTVTIDGEEVDPDETGDGGDDSPPALSHTLTIDGTGNSSRYSVSVSEALEPTGALDSDDSISGTTAEGTVLSGSDAYTFDGEITALELDGDATVSVDGERVDLLTIRRDGDEGIVKYIVETTGSIVKADVPFASINPDDHVRASKAFGRVVGGTDAYWIIGGDVTDVSTFDGEVVTRLDGSVVDLAG